jgi:hypothetical protein
LGVARPPICVFGHAVDALLSLVNSALGIAQNACTARGMRVMSKPRSVVCLIVVLAPPAGVVAQQGARTACARHTRWQAVMGTDRHPLEFVADTDIEKVSFYPLNHAVFR